MFDSSHDVEYTDPASCSGNHGETGRTYSILIERTQDPAMQRAHKIRLNPTPEQQAYFRKAAGTARFVYNWGLSEVKRALDDGRTPDSTLDLKARFNAIKRAQFPWVYAVTKCVVEGAFRNLGAALANFLSSKRGARKTNWRAPTIEWPVCASMHSIRRRPRSRARRR
jgi:transposase